ncbi:NAD(P)-dependent oxidoreductase [Microbacterium sp. Se63.02b]|uniref:NAD(P)-dependent oxidoreductase n=1 Tax=Microbacterium sp. Se63.02b TaxID=2709304 RepID=UPI0016050C60|nr:NAD(P)-dependent oxidoreductase [Microbacterium sp. Se63.02b]QNA93542.1 NAD(P)-dependent oxidoreductase [Microbacterium sp. Se63.02b]
MPDTAAAVTFVGLGAIGLPMLQRLVDGGIDVTGVDPFPGARERAQAVGAATVGAIGDAPAAAVVVAMVATPDQLDTLVDQALAAGAVRGQLWAVMSTVGPEAVVSAAARLTDAGAAVVDAPVTGGVARARTGELTIFASGAEASIARLEPVLSRFGAVRIVGDEVGRGQAIKVVNQHLCSVHIVAAAEALALATALGLDPAEVLPLLESGAAGSWMLSDRGPRMLEGTDVEVTSQINIFVKDSGLVYDAARAAGAESPLLDAARERYLAAQADGLGTRDDSRVIETYRRR